MTTWGLSLGGWGRGRRAGGGQGRGGRAGGGQGLIGVGRMIEANVVINLQGQVL